MRRFVTPGPATILGLAALVLGCSDAAAQAPDSLRELPEGQYAIEGLAGVKVVSTALSVPCAQEPTMAVGVRFTRLAQRVREVRVQRVSSDGKVLETGPSFRNSMRWQFGLIRLPTCGRLYEVRYVFYREGDRRGQLLGDFVCVLGRDGEDCPRPADEA